jgi:hypothetical protein
MKTCLMKIKTDRINKGQHLEGVVVMKFLEWDWSKGDEPIARFRLRSETSRFPSGLHALSYLPEAPGGALDCGPRTFRFKTVCQKKPF